jgi:hypothetical protein
MDEYMCTLSFSTKCTYDSNHANLRLYWYITYALKTFDA